MNSSFIFSFSQCLRKEGQNDDNSCCLILTQISITNPLWALEWDCRSIYVWLRITFRLSLYYHPLWALGWDWRSMLPEGQGVPIPEGILEKVSYDQGHPFLFVSVGILIPCLLSVCSTHCLYFYTVWLCWTLSSPLGLVVLTFWSVNFKL